MTPGPKPSRKKRKWPALLTIKACAAYLGWEYRRVYNLVRSGRIPSDDKARGVKMTDRRVRLDVARDVKRRDELGYAI